MTGLHQLRRILRYLDRKLAAHDRLDPVAVSTEETVAPPIAPERAQALEAFLLSLDLPQGARTYLEDHLPRIVRTLGLVPPPRRHKRALELGAYMQMTPALSRVLGYENVLAAYLGPLGKSETRVVTAGGEEVFRCEVALFDVDRDRFPYADAYFDLVLACEIIEHLLVDPMHMLLEIHRVLDENGTLVLTTPNVASLLAVARTLERKENPQVHSRYSNPSAPEPEIPHVREYTPNELRATLESAGFEVEYLFTEGSAQHIASNWVERLLQDRRFPLELRGEQMYCVATRRSDRPITRYPSFLYDS